ncbi:allophanate hydrolase subunit 1 [Parasphingorhabdus sp. JC815]|uniref:5-oxoprolinase subunit B family protein n=1 Tax=Parasphingorhabdus sp. JC815 TaxID=3232140 RepID=UPI0034584F02
MIPIHACDDWLSCRLDDLDAVHAASAAVRGESVWQEVVSGLDNIAVKFDPALISPQEATNLLRKHLRSRKIASDMQTTPITIPVCYDADLAPDRDWIAEKMGLSPTALIEWHSGLQFRVTMLGFMPGFAYLICRENILNIGRLPNPRQKVSAGSIGFIGDQSCIYSFDSPGGWPIIGRTPFRLFEPERSKPALLSVNQSVAFRTITRDEFDNLTEDINIKEKDA